MIASILSEFTGTDCILALKREKDFLFLDAKGRRKALSLREAIALEELLLGNVPKVASTPDGKPFQRLRRALGLKEVNSIVVIPIISREKVIGALLFPQKEPPSWSGYDVRGMEVIPSRVGLLLDIMGLREREWTNMIMAVRAFATAIDAKSVWTRGHSERVALLSALIGRRLDLDKDRQTNLIIGALLHDIGKIYIPTEILEKPGSLSEEEFRKIKEHPVIGEEVLLKPAEDSWSKLSFVLGDLLQHEEMNEAVTRKFVGPVRWHHENWDGSGYPNGLKKESIPVEARITRIADAVEAMSADRPYRKGLPLPKIVEQVEKGAGKAFDPEIAGVFLDALREGEVEPVLEEKASAEDKQKGQKH